MSILWIIYQVVCIIGIWWGGGGGSPVSHFAKIADSSVEFVFNIVPVHGTTAPWNTLLNCGRKVWRFRCIWIYIYIWLHKYNISAVCHIVCGLDRGHDVIWTTRRTINRLCGHWPRSYPSPAVQMNAARTVVVYRRWSTLVIGVLRLWYWYIYIYIWILTEVLIEYWLLS